MMAELVPRGDGTFVLKPRVAEQDTETWITPRQAGEILGQLTTKSVYKLLGDYLVYRRPLRRKILVSLRSVLALKQATSDADFWDDRDLQKRIIEQVRDEMKTRVLTSLRGEISERHEGAAGLLSPRCVPGARKG